jgi:competence protein ComEC
MRLFALAFIAGTFVLQQQVELPQFPFDLAGLAALLAVALVPPGHRVLRIALLAVSGTVLGFGLAAWRAEMLLSESLPREMEGQDAEVVGLVAGLPQLNEKGTRFVFHVERPATIPSVISLSWYSERVRGGEPIPPPQISAGQRWKFTVRLKRPRGLSNPHTFDFEPYALERGIRATGYVRAKPHAQLLTRQVDGWPYTLHRWRGEIREAMYAHLGDARLRGVLVALAIGDQDSIAADDWEVFWRTGVGHLMSISGLHITMLAGFAFTLTFLAWVRVPALALRIPARRAAVVVGTLAALAYSLMTGYAVPAQRTFVMLAVVALCVLTDRHGSPSRVLALAVLGVLALDPWAVLSAGFWLSFGAVAAIFYVMALRTGRQGKLHGAMLEQLAVTVAMLPMLMALFQEVSLVSPIANAFAIPLVSLVIVPLTIAGAFLPIPILLDAAHALMVALMSPLEWLASLPWAMLESHAPAPWTIAAAVVGCAWILAPRGFPLRACGAVWMAPMFAVIPPGPAAGEAWIDVLDVGNGLAVVVRTARHALAYDAGPTWNADADSGNRIVVPFLRGEGVGRLDGLVISHADDDHYGGAASVAYSREPGWLLSPLPPQDPLHAFFTRTMRCEAGDTWRWDGVELRVLHPARDIYDEAARSGLPSERERQAGERQAGERQAGERQLRERRRKENDRGCVLKISTRAASMLLTADVEARSELEMMKRDAASLRADVLLVPHHGSKTSSTPQFIDAVAPKVGVLSVGHRNRFRHPNAAVVERYAERSIALRRTDREGALRVVIPESGAPVISGQQATCRYWSERPCNGL